MDRLPRPGSYAAVVKGYFAHRVLAGQGGTSFGLAGEDLHYAAGDSRRVAERLSAMGVDVVGELADLTASIQPALVSAHDAPEEQSVIVAGLEAMVSSLEHIHEQRVRRQEVVKGLRSGVCPESGVRRDGEVERGRGCQPNAGSACSRFRAVTKACRCR
jgi:hypothetical protein